MTRVRVLAAVIVTAFLLAPSVTFAFPFGGRATMVIYCFNSAIYAALTGPIGGPYIWTPSTVTYAFGPPTHSGQWLLGLAGPPYACIVSIEPLVVFSGIAITMMGSSQ